MIELKNASYSYNGAAALSGVTLSVKKGESAAFMGPNGCGKTTLFKLINGIILPQSGSYLFDGAEINAEKMKDPGFSKRFHQRIGFVFQNPDVQLFCQSVYDEVAFAPRQMGLSIKETDERVGDCLSLLGLTGQEDRPPYHLSGGEKRRVSIACVLSQNPEVLVLDEPMAGLDTDTQKVLISLLSELSRCGKTILFSTHSTRAAKALAQKAVIFDKDHTVKAVIPSGELAETEEC